MSFGKLTDLQVRILRCLSDIEPPWVLTGGAALAGFHTQHRGTKDLDLFWRGPTDLPAVAAEAERRLAAAGLRVTVVRRHPELVQLRVADDLRAIVVDLVADRAPSLEEPVSVSAGGVSFRLDSPHEILVNKLSALLGRMELRDLIDVQALLESGGDLRRALADAPRKDGGFSPLTLAWVLRSFEAGALAREAGWPPEKAEALVAFRDQLVERLVAEAAPG